MRLRRGGSCAGVVGLASPPRLSRRGLSRSREGRASYSRERRLLVAKDTTGLLSARQGQNRTGCEVEGSVGLFRHGRAMKLFWLEKGVRSTARRSPPKEWKLGCSSSRCWGRTLRAAEAGGLSGVGTILAGLGSKRQRDAWREKRRLGKLSDRVLWTTF